MQGVVALVVNAWACLFSTRTSSPSGAFNSRISVPCSGCCCSGFDVARESHCEEVRPFLRVLGKRGVLNSTRRLDRALRRLVARHRRSMRIGVHIVHWPSGDEIGIHSQQSFPLASIVKLPIMIEAILQLQESDMKGGTLTLDTPIVLKETDKCIGSGELWKAPSGTRLSFVQCLELMHSVSDNTAADLALKKVRLDHVQQRMSSLQCKSIDICLSQRQAFLIALKKGSQLANRSSRQIVKMWTSLKGDEKLALALSVEAQNANLPILDFLALEMNSEKLQQVSGRRNWQEGIELAAAVDNRGSPMDIAHLLSLLAKGELLTQLWTTRCMSILAKQKCGQRRLPAYLPKETKVFHKTGTILGVVNDAGVLELGNRRNRVAVAVFIDGIQRAHEKEAEAVTARIGRIIYNSYRYYGVHSRS